MRKLITLVMVMQFAVLAGCKGRFSPITLVERLRLLGIKAEPPETDLFGQVEFSALVGDPHGDAGSFHCTWAVCLFELGNLAVDVPCPGPDSYYLTGDCGSATLRMSDLVGWLAEQGYPVDQFDPENPPVDELPVIVGVEVHSDTAPNGTALENGAGQTRGFKRIKVRLSGDELPNQNPVLTGLGIGGTGWKVGDGPVELVGGQDVLMVPEADESTRQTYVREEDDVERLEDFLFSWYSTAGEFMTRRTILDVDIHGTRLDTNKWRLPEEVAEPQVQVWLLVHDGRYGVDWLEVPVHIRSAETP